MWGGCATFLVITALQVTSTTENLVNTAKEVNICGHFCDISSSYCAIVCMSVDCYCNLEMVT